MPLPQLGGDTLCCNLGGGLVGHQIRLEFYDWDLPARALGYCASPNLRLETGIGSLWPDGRRAGPAFPHHWLVANPGLVRSEGHILMSKYPAIYWLVAQLHVGQMPTSQLTYIGVLVGEVNGS